MTPNAGEALVLRAERPVPGGRMLARLDGAVVLVAGALPGELVEARVERVQRGTIWAAVSRVDEASADRVGEPVSCGGLVLAHARYDAQLAIKQAIVADAFRRIARLTLDSPVGIEPSPVDGYRIRARLHAGNGRLGFFREGTHEVCDARPTRQLSTATCDVLDEVGERLRERIATIRHVDLAESRDGRERALHLDLAADADPSTLGALSAVGGLSGVSYAHAGGLRSHVLSGDGRVRDAFSRDAGSWTLERDVRAFFQANRYLLDRLVDHVLAHAAAGPLVDLYAGVGLFAVAVAAGGGGPVVAIEGDPTSAADLRRNAAAWRDRLEPRHEAVEVYLSRRRGVSPATVIVDPPRTGLSRRAVEGVAETGGSRLVYVSCDVATLARDVSAFVGRGYRLSELRAFDMFPATAHVEVVAVLDR